jgi:hypothetical protein
MEWESNNFNYENSTEEIVEKRDKLKENRPDWMNEELFINYENTYIKHWVETYKIEKEYDNWIHNKRKYTINMCCPLCRK